MDAVDRALIHPVLWDPDSNELAVEVVRKYPGRFACPIDLSYRRKMASTSRIMAGRDSQKGLRRRSVTHD
jgi:hypothetical protein